EWARGVEGRRWLTSVWIGVAAVLSVVGTVSAVLSNVYQHPFWGSAGAQPLFQDTQYERILYAARTTFNEWNLFSSFLLIPLTLPLGAIPVWPRLFQRSSSLVHRMTINRVTLNSWLDRPVTDPGAPYFGPEHVTSGPATPLVTARNVVLGHGAGSVNRVSIVY